MLNTVAHFEIAIWKSGCISHGLVISRSTQSNIISEKELFFEHDDYATNVTHSNFGWYSTHKSLHAITIPLNLSIKSSCS